LVIIFVEVEVFDRDLGRSRLAALPAPDVHDDVSVSQHVVRKLRGHDVRLMLAFHVSSNRRT